MEPSISRGSLIVVVPIEHPVRVGTVVVFSDPFNKSRTIAHRVIETVRSSGGELNYRTRGDANPREDARPIPDEQIIGRVRTRIPAVGTFVQSAHTIPGAALIMGLPVGALLIERSSRKRKIQRDLVPPGKTREIEVFLRTDRTYSEADILLASPVGSRP
jgi:signal peptidase